jgi:hypothetical protein
MKIKLQKPVRSQVFKYRFAKWKPDDKMIRLRDIYHAMGNCDMYPIPFPDAVGRRTPEAKIMMETLDAALAAIEQCHVYTGAGIINTYRHKTLEIYKENDNDQDQD